ncbi:FIST signal transduction protein [Persephonella sp.]
MIVKTFLEKNVNDFKKRIFKSVKEYKPDLIIFFAPYSFFEFENINSEIDDEIKCVGISSVAGIKDNKIEYGSYGGVFIKFERDGFCEIVHYDNISKNLEDASVVLKENLISESEGTNLLFSTSSNLSVNKLLNKVFKIQMNDVRLYGGIASSDAEDFRTFISLNGNLLKDGFVLLKLYNVESFNTISLGFIPVGTTYTITEAKENKIYSIDGMPILYYLNNLLKNTGIKPEDLDPLKTSEVLWEFPFLFMDDAGYISHLLVPMCYDPEDEALLFYGEVLRGSRIKLSTGDSEDILIDVKIRSEEFESIMNERGFIPDVVFNITCTARNYILLGENYENKEQEIYYEKLSNIPFTGFLTFGEIGPDRMGKAGKFYNETSILVGLKER